jgi:hypothetical protein
VANNQDMKLQLVIEAINRFQSTFEQLKTDLNQTAGGLGEVSTQSAKTDGGINVLTGSFGGLQAAVTTAFAALLAWKGTDLAKDSALLAARVETLGIVMGVVGNNAGYTKAQMEGYAQGIAKMGITTEESRQTIIGMAQANLDLDKSAQLARVSQDAAVIANMNSSETLKGIMHGVLTLQPEVLRTYGIIVNFENEYKKVAMASGRTAESLSAHEKQQIALNAVLEQGGKIAGSYEAAMGTAGKQLTSLKRYQDELKLSIGETFTPLLSEIVKDLTVSLKDMGDWFKGNPTTVRNWSASLVEAFTVVKAEIIRLSMLTDKAGGSMTSAAMLLYAPGKALGVKSSTERFNRMADMNIEFETRYFEKEKELQALADSLAARLEKIQNTRQPGTTSTDEEAKVAAAKAELARKQAEEQKLINAKRDKEQARAAIEASYKEQIEAIKRGETEKIEAYKTALKNKELLFQQGAITEEEFLKEQSSTQQNILQESINSTIAAQNKLTEEWNSKKGTYASNTERIKAHKDYVSQWYKLEEEYTKKVAELGRALTDDEIKQIQRRRQIETATREGDLKLLQEQLNAERQMTQILLEHGQITPLEAEKRNISTEQGGIEADYWNTMAKSMDAGLTDAQITELDKQLAVLRQKMESLDQQVPYRLEKGTQDTANLEAKREEARISHELADLDEREALHNVEKTGAIRQRISLTQGLLALQEQELGRLSGLGLQGTQGWLAQQAAIDGTRQKLLELKLQARDLSDDMAGGFTKGLHQYLDSLGGNYKKMADMSRETAQGMQQAFSDLFFDALQGKFKSFGDYFRSFLATMQRALANLLAQMAAQGIIKWATTPSALPGEGNSSGVLKSDGGYQWNPPVFGGSSISDKVIVPSFNLSNGQDWQSAVRNYAPFGTPPSQQATSSGPGDVKVEIVNPPGHNHEVDSVGAHFDPHKLVISVIMKEMKESPTFRTFMATGGRM